MFWIVFRKNLKGAKGVFCVSIDVPSNTIEYKKFNPFSIDAIIKNLKVSRANRFKKKAERGGYFELKKFELSEAFSKENGGVIVIAEQRYTTENLTVKIDGGTKPSTIYHHRDILVMNISHEGDIKWAEAIPKKQASADDFGLYSSYVVTIANDKMYFIFNDNPKNIFQNKIRKKIYRCSTNEDVNSLVALVEINGSGREFREPLGDLKNSFIKAVPNISKQLSNQKTLLFGDSKDKNWFGEVLFY